MFKKSVFNVNVDTLDWCKKATIRALKTMAQTAVASITVGSALNSTDWMNVVSVSLVAGIVSVLTSVAGIPEVEEK